MQTSHTTLTPKLEPQEYILLFLLGLAIPLMPIVLLLIFSVYSLVNWLMPEKDTDHGHVSLEGIIMVGICIVGTIVGICALVVPLTSTIHPFLFIVVYIAITLFLNGYIYYPHITNQPIKKIKM